MCLHQMEAIVFIMPQTFFATHKVLKIEEYHLDMTHLDQSQASKNI